MLSKELAAAPAERALNNYCGVALMLADIEYKHGIEERNAVDSALNDATKPATNLVPILKKNGYPMSPATLRRHRKGQCSCSAKS